MTLGEIIIITLLCLYLFLDTLRWRKIAKEAEADLEKTRTQHKKMLSSWAPDIPDCENTVPLIEEEE